MGNSNLAVALNIVYIFYLAQSFGTRQPDRVAFLCLRLLWPYLGDR